MCRSTASSSMTPYLGDGYGPPWKSGYLLQNQDRMIQMRESGFADSDQVSLWAHRLDVLGARAVDKRREPEILALSDLRDGHRIYGGVREMGQQLRCRNDGLVKSAGRGEAGQLV